MKMFRYLLAPILAVGMALPAAAEKIPLDVLSNYINSLKTATTTFKQINGDGTVSTGTLYMHRPGRARFEYAEPDDTLVVAGGSQVAIFDGKSNTGPEQYPLKRTPLSLILARNVNLRNAKMLVAHQAFGQDTVVRAQDPEHPEYGSIDLIFSDNPVRLKEWIINDSGGGSTRVMLNDLQTGVSLRAGLFNITKAIDDRNR
ncbi:MULTISPECIES: LolA family protein [Halocynthiibacter]|uniref:Outer membrane lipoprotein carrier protein LolA n=1 Tax=Halocynthiibacter halioticoli TaxID=2986804 RepID=A0AAE3J0X2_9RHOB|nr:MULTISPECIES: outer membrane lipoprotein carrier protein LolA [Halocynthiibacter]MCV6825715.1 outer membrane lipoprotein carrier protein LolA [Halocynthiibacter halioticoli]MCW4058716.1 outer membrane lipoprotein carrier protein LolA [Halocynthiibacter sp. SDUM655004]